MEHLYKHLENKSREDYLRFIAKAGKANSIEVSLKIDGTPLQMSVDDILDNKFSFHSKGSSLQKKGPLITSLDLFMNPAFYEQVQSLKEVSKNNKILSYVHLLDFEIVVPNEHHIIQYDNNPEGHMYLLAATSTNDKFIDSEVLKAIAKSLKVDIVPSKTISFDKEFKKLCNFAFSYQDYKDDMKIDDGKYIEFMQEFLGKDFISGDCIEGIVITFHGGDLDGQQFKIDSPKFVGEMSKRKETKMSYEEENEIKSILDLALQIVDKSQLSKWSNDPLENMIINFDKSLGNDPTKLKQFADKCNASDKSRKNANPKAIPERYKDKASNQDWVIGLQNFIWLFRKQRKGLLKNANEYAKIIASGAK